MRLAPLTSFNYKSAQPSFKAIKSVHVEMISDNKYRKELMPEEMPESVIDLLKEIKKQNTGTGHDLDVSLTISEEIAGCYPTKPEVTAVLDIYNSTTKTSDRQSAKLGYFDYCKYERDPNVAQIPIFALAQRIKTQGLNFLDKAGNYFNNSSSAKNVTSDYDEYNSMKSEQRLQEYYNIFEA